MSERTKFYYGWWIVFICAVVLAIAGPASITVANLYQEPIVTEFGITKSVYAIANTIVLGVGIISAPIMSRKYVEGHFTKLFALSLLIYGVSYASYSIAPNIYIYYFISLFVGFGFSASLALPISILLNNWFTDKIGLAISLTYTGSGFGGVIFSQLVNWSINEFGWRTTYMLYGGLILLICVPLVYFFVKLEPAELGLDATKNTKIIKDQGEENNGLTVSFSMGKPFFIMLIIGSVLLTLSLNGAFGQFPPFIQGVHDSQTAALVISIYSLAGVVGKLILGALNDKFGIIFSTSITILFMTLSFILMLNAENYNLMLLGAVFFGFGSASGSIITPLLVSAMYSGAEYAKAYGLVASGNNLGLMIGSLFVATIADITGSYKYAWAILAVTSALTGVLWVGSYIASRKELNKIN